MAHRDDHSPSPLQQDHRFPCTTCGADMRFSPENGALVCDHCGASQTLELGQATGPHELDYRSAIEDLLPQQDMEDTRVSECPNCGAPVVIDTGLHRQIKPRGLLPFALSETSARDAMNDWLGGLWFAPNGLKDYARKGRKLSGIYVPYWTFDADTKSHYSGMRGDDYYVTKTVMRDGKSQQVRERRTKWRNASGRVARFFDDVLVLASTSLPPKYTKGLEPWDLQEMEPYLPDYIAGFRAESYSVEIEDGYRTARGYMDAIILRDVKFDIGGDRQQVASVNTQISNVTFKHVLLPVWMAAYKYRGTTYRFVVNGRSGRVQGERPWSAWKIAFAVIAGALIAGAIGYLASHYQ
jgi:DNA-directed RNA polymerase subunit RPC12/RpoP